MLYYLIIVFFVFGSFASEHKLLSPVLNNFHTLIHSTDPTNIKDHNGNGSLVSDGFLREIFHSQSLAKNANASSLLTQILNVSPKSINNIVQLLKKLAQEAKKEIDNLDELLKRAHSNLMQKTRAENKAREKLNQAIGETAIAKAKENVARAYRTKTFVELKKAEEHHTEIKDRVKSEKPGVVHQLKVLNQVIALLTPIAAETYFQHKSSMKLKRGNIVKSNLVMFKTFEVSFDIFINNQPSKSNGGSWPSIFHMTQGSNDCAVCRVPAVWLSTTKQFYICSPISGHGNYCNYLGPAPTKKWVHIEIKQVFTNGKYLYTTKLDKKVGTSMINGNPKVYDKMKLYMANPWQAQILNGQVKNIRVTSPAVAKGK